ncbi:MAG TPA: hypothetical protein VI750_08115 [Pyrinomonadaceae bacterium]|nr:hypothetical protein [Pyrinomonadaceae bacterium]
MLIEPISARARQTSTLDAPQLKGRSALRVALIVDSPLASKYVFDLAEWASHQKDLDFSHLIVQKVPALEQGRFRKAIASARAKGLFYMLKQVGITLIRDVESLILKQSATYKNHVRKYNLFDIVPKSLTVTPIISKSGFVYRYDACDIENIKSICFDILIRCGTGILRGEILAASKLGIISFHHGDTKINRGGPAGFWEVYLKQDSTGFTIQRLTEELDGGNILFQGHVSTKFFWQLNQAALLEKSNVYLKRVLLKISTTRQLSESYESLPYCNEVYTLPSLGVQARYCFNLMRTVLVKAFNILSKREDCWSVAFKYRDWRDLVMCRGIRIKNPPNRFLADPFVISHENGDYCFVEDYDFATSRGCIAVYKLSENSSERLGEAIVEPFHMSYPYIFKYQSRFYMCPETCENKDIRLYESEGFPLKWKLKKIIMADVSAADTTIFEHDGLWWLFTNIEPTNLGDHCTELYIFYADSPLADNWTPHAKNPILVDSRKARMGGILRDNKTIYRVAQRQGFDMYGKSSSINKITLLSKDDFIEEKLFKIEPNFFSGIRGTHHMHSNGRVTVYDFVEHVKVKIYRNASQLSVFMSMLASATQ